MSAFSRLYDRVMAPIEGMGFRRRRAALLAEASGLVLEVGAGTGLNLPHYRAAGAVVATDPDPAMLVQAVSRARAAAVPVHPVVADAQALPFASGLFDSVVGTCTFCTIPDAEAAFREAHRVLKPGGELRLLEHVRAPSPLLAHLQDWATPGWSRLAGGCRLNRDTLQTARDAGFTTMELQTSFRGIMVRAVLRRA